MKKLFLVETDEQKLYVVAREEYEARDKVHAWNRERFHSGKPVNIRYAEELADEKTNGFTAKLIL